MSSAQKYKKYLHWTNRAKMLFATNKVPETQDDTRAFFRRFHIIECKNYFPADKRDPHILDKICTPTEISGLLNWALKGLHELLENGKFSETTDYREKRRRYIRKSNSAKSYIEENLEHALDHDKEIPEKELYEKYVLWCRKQKLPSKRKGEFTKNMHQHLPEAKQTMIRINGTGVHAWQYVIFKNKQSQL